MRSFFVLPANFGLSEATKSLIHFDAESPAVNFSSMYSTSSFLIFAAARVPACGRLTTFERASDFFCAARTAGDIL